MEAHSRWNPTRVAGVLAFALAYYLLGELSYGVAYSPSGSLAAWWAPSGLALAVLIRTPQRRWLPFVVAGLVGSFLVNMAEPQSIPEVLVRCVADLTEPLTGAWLLQRRFGRGLRLGSVHEVFAFTVFGAIVGPTAGSAVVTLGTALVSPAPPAALASFVAIWWGSSILGVMLFAPPLLTFRKWPPRLPTGNRLAELVLLCAAVVLITLGAFRFPGPGVYTVVLAFCSFPVLAWAAVRFGPEGASRSALALSILSIWPYLGTSLGQVALQLVTVQSVYALGAFTALTLSALTSEAERLRKEAQAQAIKAEESLALLETALQTAPFGVAFFDRGLSVTRLNDLFASLGGQPAGELVGVRLRDAVPCAASQLEPLVRSVLESGKPEVGRDVEIPDCETRHWLCSVYPVRTRRGRVWGTGLLLIDVSERRAQEEERARLFREAQEAVRVREDFLSIASHELKTPLTPLAMRLHLMRRKAEAGDPIDPESIDKSLRSLRQLTDLINDLLDATRIAHGRLALHPEPLSLQELVRESTEALGDSSARHRLELDLPEEPVWVKADRHRLTQVITNLVDNAIKYSPEGGTVWVRIRPIPDRVELAVSDQGIGIPQDHLGRLFDRFHRASNVRQSFGGLGLGLYITRDIVEGHGGRIWAESQPGSGATFRVVLPRMASSEVGAVLH